MASTYKTANLGLNNWTETDCPKRSDFVADNLTIDSLVGNHIKDSSQHLTAEEKDRVSAPFDVITYYGTGEATTTIKLNYVPKLAIVCKKNSPFQKAATSYTVINSAIASSVGTTGGLVISNNTVVATQSSSATNSMFYNLNESTSEYMLITFK